MLAHSVMSNSVLPPGKPTTGLITRMLVAPSLYPIHLSSSKSARASSIRPGSTRKVQL